MISRNEVAQAVSLVFPDRPVRQLVLITRGFDFIVYRVDFEDRTRIVFRGQRNYDDPYLGPQDFGQQLVGEARFYGLLPDLPVPQVVHLESDSSRLGFPFAFFTYMPGTPLDDLLDRLPLEAHRTVDREMGRLLARIHRVSLDHVGRLWSEGNETWSDYFSRRLRGRLEPYIRDGILTAEQRDRIGSIASEVEIPDSRLLHMDFRPTNMLARIRRGTVQISGIVDAANCLAGDPAFDLARLDEGVGLSNEFIEGYRQSGDEIDRGSEEYVLYRLEAAAVLASVYMDTPDWEFRLERLRTLIDQILP